MKHAFIYLTAIVIANIGFSYIPMIPLPGGHALAPMSFLVGFIFIFRDLAQRIIGHKVLLVMLVGVGLSYLLADPFVAIASAVAFAISELIDWGVYTTTNRPLKQRILLSSLISTPIDSAVFMLLIGILNWHGLAIMTASKMVAVGVIWKWMR
jgi:uncharacterized PurR-regulated membrane protein YhhQ (DUF165 family)